MEKIDRKLDWFDQPERVWVLMGESMLLEGGPGDAYTTLEGAQKALESLTSSEPHEPVEITLHRPSLRPVYGGPTLLEALWNEMDRLMESLMTGQGAEDGGDKYRAQELAWVIAIVTNAYDPSVDRVRAEAVERWNVSQDPCNCSADERVYCHATNCHGGANIKEDAP